MSELVIIYVDNATFIQAISTNANGCVSRFKVVLAALLASAMAFMPTKMSSSRGVVTMMAERSKSLPFLLKPAKVSALGLSPVYYLD